MSIAEVKKLIVAVCWLYENATPEMRNRIIKDWLDKLI